MKTALITTTINVPTVLKLYRQCGPDVAFFVAGDQKTPTSMELSVCMEKVRYLSPSQQEVLGYKCSDLIGWNTIARRNIALLEALKWGAEIIMTIDDDNIPMGTDYFDRFETVLGAPFSGIQVSSGYNSAEHGKWFDVGYLLEPDAPHRGFPINVVRGSEISHVVNARIGVAAGICLGDPDISAVTRMANAPIVYGVSELLRSGVVVRPDTHTVFNSQNTAFLRQFAPCFLMCPQFGRYDDIFASLIAQRVMREHGYQVHHGQPFVFQQRNSHNLINDLKAEMWGMEHIVEFASFLDGFDFQPGRTVLEMVRMIYGVMASGGTPFIPDEVQKLGLAWCDDVESVL